MARTSKARVFRSTQTSPNATTTRDLTTAFGTTPNAVTSAQYIIGGTATWRRWNPNSATASAVDPAGITTATGEAWRDTVGESTAEQVRYAAGTWTVRVLLTKTGQTPVPTDISIRVTVIVYRVTSAGAHVAEIGRANSADTTLSTAALAISASFTTGATITFNAADKVQVECYVTPLAAGLPAAPATAVNVNFVVDETSANSGANLTAIPAHDILYGRTFTEAIPTTETLVRAMAYKRTTTESIPTTETLGRVKGANRSMTEAIPTTESLVRAMAYKRTNTEAIALTETLTRAAAYSRAFTEAIPTTDAMVRRAGYGRIFTEAIPTTESLTRIKGANRSLTESIPTTDTLARAAAYARAFTEPIPTTDAMARAVGYARTNTEAIPTTEALVRQVAFKRSTTEAIPTTETLVRVVAYFRALADTIPTTDTLVRSMGYSRGLTEQLATGGGGGDPVTPADIAAIANAVWDELTAEGRATDSYGALVRDRLDAAVSTRATGAAVTALGAPAQASALTTVQGLVDDLEARLTAARALLLDNLNVAVSTRATPADVTVTVTPRNVAQTDIA